MFCSGSSKSLGKRLPPWFNVGRGHSRIFLLRESWSSGIENFREFGIPEKFGIRIFGNLVFLFGITEFSGFLSYWYILKISKIFPKKFFKIFFFSKFSKKIHIFFSFPVQKYWIFGIPEHFRDSWTFSVLSIPDKSWKFQDFFQEVFNFLNFLIHTELHMQKE